MARAMTRWAVAGVLACCLVAVALLPPRGIGTSETARYGMGYRAYGGIRLNLVRRRFEDALARLRLLELRDSLIRLPGGTGPSKEGLRVVADPGVPRRMVDHVVDLSEQAWDRTGPHDTTMSVLVAALVDTAAEVNGYRREPMGGVRTAHLVPTADGERTCVRVIDFGVSAVESFSQGESWIVGWRQTGLARGIGACAYYAAFGVPGRDIAQWLETSGYLPLLNADWSGAEPEERYSWIRDNLSVASSIWGLHHDLIGCAAGDRVRCGLAVRAGVDPRRGPPWPATFEAPGVVFSRYGYYRTKGLGPAAQEYLGDMVGEFGRERFARFWRSEAPLEEAFETAMDMRLDEWTMVWARRYIGEPRSAGQVPWSSVLMSLMLAACVVGAAGLCAGRRQVG